MKKILTNKKGTIIVVFSYFVIFILLPLLAVGYDLAMMQIYKTHLDNIAQVSALSCQPHGQNRFREECKAAMAKVAALNLNVKEIKNAHGMDWQADSPETNRDKLTIPITAKDNMQTKVFSLKNTKYFSLDGGVAALNSLLNGGPDSKPDMSNSAIRNTFRFTGVWSETSHSINSFSIKGKYKPLFLKFLGKAFPQFKDGIPIESSPITVRAVINNPS